MSRRLRAIVLMALLWGAAWAVLGWAVAAGPLVAVAQSGGFGAGGVPRATLLVAAAQVALRWAAFGAVGGALFAAALGWRGLRVRAGVAVDSLSVRRAAGWGGVAGALLAAGALLLSAAVTPGAALAFLGLATVLGMASGGGAVALAQRPAARLAEARLAGRLPPGA
jgi:hypothetical protein